MVTYLTRHISSGYKNNAPRKQGADRKSFSRHFRVRDTIVLFLPEISSCLIPIRPPLRRASLQNVQPIHQTRALTAPVNAVGGDLEADSSIRDAEYRSFRAGPNAGPIHREKGNAAPSINFLSTLTRIELK